MSTEQAEVVAAQAHLAAAQRIVAAAPLLSAGTAERPVERVAVVGMGTMGAGIASVFAGAGFPVIAIGRTPASRDSGIAAIGRSLAGLVKRGKIDQAEADRRLARVIPGDGPAGIAGADLVIEAAAEEMAVKRALFAEFGRTARNGAILATNTSYLDIDALGEASGRPADVCGLHFFNPAPAMRLVEVIRAGRTAPDVIATLMSLAARIGKLPVLAGASDGFVVNRMLAKRSREGVFLLEEGAAPERIDAVLTGFGFPMGPYALADLAGIDVQHAARQARLDRLNPRERRADFVDQLHGAGRFGQKTGAGWYRYGEDRRPTADPATAAMLEAHRARHAIAPRGIEDREIRERCLYAMVNEGARIVGEGVVARPHEIDVAMVNGIGFPAATGGPMWWADAIGLPAIRDAMLRYRDIAGAEYWTPAPLIEACVAEGRGFYGSAAA